MISLGFTFGGIIMASTRKRHDFLADADVTKLLAELVEGSGATKTEIIIQSIRAFAECGNDSEFAQRTAKRFDTLSRELQAVRNDLEATRRDHKKMQCDATFTREYLAVFVRFCMVMSGHFPVPEGDKEAIGQKRLRWFEEQVERRIAAATTPPTTSKDNAGHA
jgi:hypothetical protein